MEAKTEKKGNIIDAFVRDSADRVSSLPVCF